MTEIERVIVDSGHSRCRSSGRDLDDVLGFVHAKDLLELLERGTERPCSARPPPRAMLDRGGRLPLVDVLVRMQQRPLHLAVVVDERAARSAWSRSRTSSSRWSATSATSPTRPGAVPAGGAAIVRAPVMRR